MLVGLCFTATQKSLKKTISHFPRSLLKSFHNHRVTRQQHKTFGLVYCIYSPTSHIQTKLEPGSSEGKNGVQKNWRAKRA